MVELRALSSIACILLARFPCGQGPDWQYGFSDPNSAVALPHTFPFIYRGAGVAQTEECRFERVRTSPPREERARAVLVPSIAPSKPPGRTNEIAI